MNATLNLLISQTMELVSINYSVKWNNDSHKAECVCTSLILCCVTLYCFIIPLCSSRNSRLLRPTLVNCMSLFIMKFITQINPDNHLNKICFQYRSAYNLPTNLGIQYITIMQLYDKYIIYYHIVNSLLLPLILSLLLLQPTN